MIFVKDREGCSTFCHTKLFFFSRRLQLWPSKKIWDRRSSTSIKGNLGLEVINLHQRKFWIGDHQPPSKEIWDWRSSTSIKGNLGLEVINLHQRKFGIGDHQPPSKEIWDWRSSTSIKGNLRVEVIDLHQKSRFCRKKNNNNLHLMQCS